MFDVAVLGSANLDLVVRTGRRPATGETVLGTDYAEYPGGKGLNQAVAAARSGARTAFVGAIGDDDAGQQLRAVAVEAGIDIGHLQVRSDAPTGRAVITVSDDADNSIIVVPGANSLVEPDFPPCRVLTAQLEIPPDVVTSAFTSARKAGIRTVLNPAPATHLAPELLAVTDVIVPNEHEIDLIGGPAALREVSTIIVTLGDRGVRATEARRGGDPLEWHVEAFAARPVDTTGAGDAFCGALAARLAAGDELRDAVRWASAAGALATTTHGAVPSLPHRATIAGLLSSATAG